MKKLGIRQIDKQKAAISRKCYIFDYQHVNIFFHWERKLFLNYLANIVLAPTFALPKENWVFTHVSANQNQITVLRSQPGR